MNHSKLFYFVAILLSSLLILFLYSCKKDPVSSVPLNAVATSEIGSAGGTLETEGFSLQVPESSFADDVTLNLYISPEPSSFGETNISQSFMVEGLPKTIEKPLRLAIKYNGELSDSSYIAHGVFTEETLTSDSSLAYSFISTKDSSGYLIGYLSIRYNQNSGEIFKSMNANENSMEQFEAVTKYKDFETIHFILKYPPSFSSTNNLQEFGTLIEGLYNKITIDLNFKYNLEQNPNCGIPQICWNWPLEIYIIDEMEYETSLRYDYEDGPEFAVKAILLESSKESTAKALIGQKLLSMATITYLLYLDEQISNNMAWFLGSLIAWSQVYFSEVLESPYFTSNELAPFIGIQNGSDINLKSHALGMSSLLQYLVKNNKLNPNKIGSMYNEMTNKEQATHPIKSILYNVEGLIADWWPDYFVNLIKGDIYNIESNVFFNMDRLGGSWEVNADEGETIIKNFYPDLSARRFIVNLNKTDIDPETNLYLDAYRPNAANNDGVATIVFGLNNNSLQHLDTAKNSQLKIEKLKKIYDNGIRQLLVVVVNSTHNGTDYLGETDIELKLEVKKEASVPDFNRCGISIKSGAKYDYVTPDNAYSTENETNVNSTWEDYPGTFSENTFTASYYRNWDSQTNPLTITGSITATFNDDYSTITNIIWNQTHTGGTSSSPHGTFTKSINLDASDIPFDPNEYFPVYQVKMEETCDHISSYTDTQTAPEGLGWTMPDYWCNGDSKVSIRFTKE